MKKFLSSILLLAIVFASIPLQTAFASTTTKGKVNKSVSYTYNKKSKVLTFSGKGKLVANITYGSFGSDQYWDSTTKWDKYKSAVKKIVVKKGITEIAPAAFSDCKVLTSVSLPTTLKKIGSYAFYRCSKLKTVKIPDSVTHLGTRVFWKNSALKTVTMPKNLKTIKSLVFVGCNNLQKVSISKNSKYFCTYYGAFYDKKKTTLYFNPANNANNSKKVKIASTTKIIKAMSFANAKNLKTITIPKSVTEIRGGAFYNCKSLNSINFASGSKLTKIEDYYNYYGDDLDENYGAFEKCLSLTKLILPDSTKTLGAHAFRGCSKLNELYLGKSFDSVICSYSIKRQFSLEYKTELKNINVSADNTKYSSLNGVVYNKSQTALLCYPSEKTDSSYTVLKTVKTIETFGFNYNNYITEVILPDGLQELKSAAIITCKNLSSISIPKSVIKIGRCAIGYINPNLNYIADYDLLYIENCKPYNIKIKCYENSVAINYAKENQLDFEIIK